MPIVLSPNHPSYKTVMRRNRGAAPSSTQENSSGGPSSIATTVVATDAPAATSTFSYDSASNHSTRNPIPSTPPRRRRRPSSTPSPFNLEESPEFDPVFLHALSQDDTPPRSSSVTSLFPAFSYCPNHRASNTSHSSVVDALLPPIDISNPVKEHAPLRRPITLRSPPSTPTRPPSSRAKRLRPITRQPLASTASGLLLAQTHGAQVGNSKGKGKRWADESDDEEPTVTPPKRARITFNALISVVENAPEPAAPNPEPAPAPAAPSQDVRVLGERKRRLEDAPFPLRVKKTRFAIDQPALLKTEDAAGPSQPNTFGSIFPDRPVHGAQGLNNSPLARTKTPTGSRPSAARPSAYAHDHRAAPYARQASPCTAGTRKVRFSVPHLEESPVAHISRRLQGITISAETSAAVPASVVGALLWPADVILVDTARSEIPYDVFDIDGDWVFLSEQGTSSQVEASAMCWAADSGTDADEVSDQDMGVDMPGYVDIYGQDGGLVYLRPFRLDADGDVIMRGPCTLRIPSNKFAQKAVVACNVRKRRLEASDKRRRLHLLQ
ncbi:hypothetical protein BOTBODRAFT_536703 [Botryobasidium botryosum FD-172 SS1]|uniref:Uncharacterized protein n=1 Tax=Botryobasidium botryosum (strain FD-172 SS1) TaxID=930990 RepID=A0A067MB74_BOTB1|nr:hypothetical protein BOTBODRAFT_536703 [Botryobasidium botryosum FD-172 SS1]